MKPKAKKESFHHNYNGKFFTYIYFIVCLLFLFIDKFMSEEKKLPTVTASNTLHAFLPHESLFEAKYFLTPQPLLWGRGVGFSETEQS